MKNIEVFEDREFRQRMRALDVDICPACCGLGSVNKNDKPLTCNHCRGKGWIRNGRHN